MLPDTAGKVFSQWQALLLEKPSSFLVLDKFMHGDQSLRTMVCFVHLVLLAPLLSLKWLYPQCVLRLPDCTIYKEVYFVSGFSL